MQYPTVTRYTYQEKPRLMRSDITPSLPCLSCVYTSLHASGLPVATLYKSIQSPAATAYIIESYAFAERVEDEMLLANRVRCSYRSLLRRC